MLKVIELFGGIGACTQALKRIGIDFKVVDYVEIDKYAVASYNAMNGTNYECQDICEYDKYIEADLIMHGSPCQDFSIAGNQAGGDEGTGTRSSLMYETIRIVNKIKPKFVIWENVKNLLSKKHKHNFDKYIDILNEGGYNSYYQVLNAKDYRIPQNRERVFTISIRKDIDNGLFKFPEKQELKLKLKDMLEEEVDEKYYLKDSQTQKIQFQLKDKNTLLIDNSQARREGKPREYNEISPSISARDYKEPRCIQVGNINPSGKGQNGQVIDANGLARTVTIEKGEGQKILVKNATKKGYLEAFEGDSVNLQQPNSKTRRGRVGKEVSQILQCTDNMGVVNDLRIRKLTPKECWRLMGFSDEVFEKAEKVNSNSQLYKQAGNSIVVDVLEKIFRNLLEGE